MAAKMGLLIQEEAFDTWYGGKKEYDYGRFFEEEATHPEAKTGDFWSDYDLRTMIERGKNNPAIFMWSLGNEVSEANGDAHSLKTIKRLLERVKEVDDSRFVTMGMDQFRFGDGSGGHEKIANLLDVVGLNYSEDNIDAIRKRHPKWRLYGSETSSTTRTRDSYFRPDKEWVGDNRRVRNFEQSDYGNDRVPWGKTATTSWIADRDRLDYAGQFIWTGVDYIGEPTPWHNQNDTPVKSSYFGIVDTAGIPKNDYYLYQSQWLDLDQHPMVHILPHWNWEIHKSYQQVVDKYGDIPVRVYSNAGSVELFLNGKSQGRKTFQEKWTSDGRKYQEGASSEQLYLEWPLPYQPGELHAVAYDRQGQIVAEDRVVTAGKPAKIGLHAEKTQLEPDEQDLLYLYFDVLDKDGNWVPTASNQLYFQIEGPARIVGVDNGRQASRERYKAQKNGRFKRKAFHGRGVLLVQSLEKAGLVRVKASARGLEPASFDLLVGETFDCKSVKNQRLFEIRVDKQAGLQEGNSPAIGLYPQTVDNPVNKVGNSEVIWETSGSAHAIINQGVLHCLSAGDLAIRAIYQGKTYKTHLQVAENSSLGKTVSVRPLRLYTDRGTYPQLPSSVLVDYESGGVKRVKVVWEEIPKEDLARFHEFMVSGQLEGVNLKASVQVCVQGICAIEPERVWTLVKETPHLPDRVKLVLSDDRRDTAKVTWDELDPQVYAQVGECVLTGQVAGCELPATVTIYVTDASVDGEVISNQWTGSNLPLVFASHSEPNHPASYLNDKVIAQKKSTANTWIAKSEQASVGILFGDAGILKPRFVDNLTLYYVENQEYVAVEPTFIDYYVGNEPSLPRTPNHLDKDSLLKQEENWRPVSAIRKVSSDKDEELRFEFDKVETYALRLRFEGLASPLALTELQVHAKKVKKNVDRK
ncbi:beta-galactosidase/beta-glucuronidase%2C truncated [Streptococcus pneumoniae]|nr:beta-galactosidase/beta-glucuronidase%2C truncated [Streptococcus pneumoniae]CIS52632.1 beta-galactosidase/beta-glucuronidase%2C truncated [Streptococcus pneumoniae]